MSNWSTRRRNRGQSLVEFAIVLPILLLLISGGADLARAFFVGIQVSDAARGVALYIANHPQAYLASQQQPELLSVAQENASSGLLSCPANGLHVEVASNSPYSDQYTAPGTGVYQQVVVYCKLPLLTPGLPSPVKIEATATALVQP